MTGTTTTDLLVITASNGENLKLAQRFIAAAEARRCSAQLVDLTQIELPLFNPRLAQDAAPAALDDLRTQMHHSPRWVICAPEYNGSIPPILSNAIAWLSTQDEDFRSLFNGRPVGIATFSGGGGMELLLSLRIQLSHLGADVLGRQLLSNHNKPPSDAAIDDLLNRLLQRHPLQIP
ncbi:MAG: NADPH-dependent FMN reductase [Synechococcus sp.]